ncbi:hypothetical protein [Brevibacillus sp. SYSU BS000544]|uniref:hypothetical protein n=1 Tax=Brevibacillus sp. SYSU BS000544 TaxID=3416443 RepID=UPI003CE50B16
MKCLRDWKGSLNEYLSIGDLVDDEFVDHFLNVMPPACWTSQVIQLGEPHSHINGKATFATLKRTPEGWRYAGHCYRGQTTNVG